MVAAVGPHSAPPLGFFCQVASTAIVSWSFFPDIICDGQSDQEEIMTAICEAKGATYDGVDCVGDLNDATFTVSTEAPTVVTGRCI